MSLLSISIKGLLIPILLLIIAAAFFIPASYFAMKKQAKKLRTVNFNLRDLPVFKGKTRGEGSAKIAFISDLHFPLCTPDCGEIIRRLTENDCDCIMIGGDLCQNSKGIGQMHEFMRELSRASNVPIYAVLGNHDNHEVCALNETARNNYKAAIEACGDNIKVLSDELAAIPLAGLNRKIFVGGLEDSRIADKGAVFEISRAWKLRAEAENASLVLLNHNPDIATMLCDGAADIILCGHTHGGQVYIPFNLEFLILRKDILPKKGYKYGFCDYNGKNRLFITCGVGCSWLPIRFRTTAEIVFVHI